MGNCIRKTYVEFLYHGLLLDGNSIREVESRDILRLEVPKKAYAFSFFDLVSLVVEVDGKKVEMVSERISVSSLHYYGGKLYTITEAMSMFPDQSVLIENMIGLGASKIVSCRHTGRLGAFMKSNIFIEEVAG